jgi:flagellar operon protein
MADSRIDPTRIPIERIGVPETPAAGKTPKPSGAAGAVGFDRVLREQVTGLRFSAHAEERIGRRNIQITLDELERLKGAVERAREKGGKDTLVVVDDKAFVVSVENRTVITALSGNAIKEGVFTNIDSAVIS